MSGAAVDAVRILTGRDAMVSHMYPAQLEIAAEVCRTVALDNGAFSAWLSGDPVTDWCGYYDWCEKWRRHPSVVWACIPDVIDGNERDNDALLEQWPHGNFGVPVWHLHESIDRLLALGTQWPLVALGSSGEYAKVASPKWWSRMAEAMAAICDKYGRPICNLHGLRMLDPKVLAHLPLASADSTNVARNIAMDNRWRHPYAPPSAHVRAAVIMDRIESHAKATRWCGTAGLQQNFELLDCGGCHSA